MRAIKTSWAREAGHLVGRWSEAKPMQVPYNPPWLRDAANPVPHREDVSPLVLELDFLNRLSPFAGRGWFERAFEGFTSRTSFSH